MPINTGENELARPAGGGRDEQVFAGPDSRYGTADTRRSKRRCCQPSPSSAIFS